VSDPTPPAISKAAVFVAVVRRSAPRLVEASLIPTALFYCCLVMVGVGAAYAAALFWLYAAAGSRLVRRRPVPPLLVLGTIGITVKTAVSVASGSTFVYFAQPVLGSLVIGCVFLVSVALGRPLVQALALEFWPLTPEMLADPTVVRLLRRLTFLWAGVNFAVGAATLTLLVVLPLPLFVAVKQPVAWAITGGGIALTIDRSVRTARRAGFAADRRPTTASAAAEGRGLAPAALPR
jgi:hypothetical protein